MVIIDVLGAKDARDSYDVRIINLYRSFAPQNGVGQREKYFF